MDDYVYYVSSDTGSGVQICRVPSSNLSAKPETLCIFDEMTGAEVISDIVASDGKLYFYYADLTDQELVGFDVSARESYEYYMANMFGELYSGNVNVGDDGYVYFTVELNDSDMTTKICRVPEQEFWSGDINVDTIYTTTAYHGIWSLNLITDNGYMTLGIFDSDFNEVLIGMNTDGSSSDPVVLGNY
jgi:hypothetical protein